MASRISLNSLTSSLRSKKKFRFEVQFDLLELENCTYMTGLLYGKIHLKDGGSFSKFSERVEVHKHRVRWNSESRFPCKMYANASTGVLEPCHCKVSVRKETKGGRSSTKLGYVKINLAEYAGAGEVYRKYLLEGYNENKQKSDNSMVKVRVYLRQTSGDAIYKAPTPMLYDIDEGIGDDDFLSLHSATPRASTVSTVSGLSIGTGGFGSQSGSDGNLRGLESIGGRVDEEQSEAGGSEDTVVEQATSIETASTTLDNSTTKELDSPQPLTKSALQKPQQTTTQTNNLQDANESCTSTEIRTATGSYKDLRSSPTLRQAANHLMPSMLTTSSLNRRLKAGPSVSSSLVTALPGLHRRQASLGVGGSPSPVLHKRHNSFSIPPTPLQLNAHDVTSLQSNRTRLTTVTSQSRVEQSRVNNESVLNNLLANSDLTADADSDKSLKLYVDTQRGVTVMTGHELADKNRFKQIDVFSEDQEAPIRPKRHKKRSQYKEEDKLIPNQ